MRAGVGETAFDGRSVAGGFGEAARGVWVDRRLFFAIAEVVRVLLVV